MSTERKQVGKCASCANTGFIWLGHLQRMAVCPVCRRGSLDVRASEQEGRTWPLSSAALARIQVFEHYGSKCACCGTAESLSIDHVNGNGAAHRAELGGATIHVWLVKNNFPDGFQVLCGPCNTSKGRGERCRMPHPELVWPHAHRGDPQ